jgi:hypothetical protein
LFLEGPWFANVKMVMNVAMRAVEFCGIVSLYIYDLKLRCDVVDQPANTIYREFQHSSPNAVPSHPASAQSSLSTIDVTMVALFLSGGSHNSGASELWEAAAPRKGWQATNY